MCSSDLTLGNLINRITSIFATNINASVINASNFYQNGNSLALNSSLANYYLKSNPYSYYNSSNFLISNYATNIKVDSLGNWSLDKSGYLKNTGGSATGTYNFNGGFSSGGLSIINGDLYGQGLHFVNMTGLNVTSIATNGSLYPTLTNSFDLGNGTYKWRNGVFSGDVNATTLNGNLDWSYLQSVPSYVKDWNSSGLIKDWQTNINSANTSVVNWVLGKNYALTSSVPTNNNQLSNGNSYYNSSTIPTYVTTETDPLAYNGTLAYNSSLANYYLKSNPNSYYNSSNFLISDYYLASNPSGYITSYTETDPIWTSEKANYYLASNPSGYISSYTETDPLWTADKSSYVPYTGATSALNVGANNVVTTAGNKICLNQACSRYMEDNSTGVIIVG